MVIRLVSSSWCCVAELYAKRLGPLRSRLVPDAQLSTAINHVFDSDTLYVPFVVGLSLELEMGQQERFFGWHESPASDGFYAISMPQPGEWTLLIRYQGDEYGNVYKVIVHGRVAWCTEKLLGYFILCPVTMPTLLCCVRTRAHPPSSSIETAF
jgi:hypothetical protein